MADTSKLVDVNATLDRFAKLIEENAQQLRKDKAEYDRQRAEDRAEYARQRAEDRADWKKRLKELSEQVGGHANTIGELTEAMTISDNIIDLVNKFEGIDVSYFSFNTTRKYPTTDSRGNQIRKQHEVDGYAAGAETVVVIEAKTTLTSKTVKHFLEKTLANFKTAHPDHQDKDLYGALTFIRIDKDARELAEQHGLFVIKASPPDVELVNSEGFKPTKA